MSTNMHVFYKVKTDLIVRIKSSTLLKIVMPNVIQ